jgi:hypothetical protein
LGITRQTLVLYLPAGFLDVFRLSSHLNGILLYHVLLGGHDTAALVQAGSDNSLLGLALAQQYPLNFTTKAGDSALVGTQTKENCLWP